jgi:hypothetical protein
VYVEIEMEGLKKTTERHKEKRKLKKKVDSCVGDDVEQREHQT